MVRGRLRSAGWLVVLSAGSAWAQLATIHTVDSGGVGQYSSVAYGADGLPLISYYDVANGDLKVAHCNDVACATSTKTTLDSAGDVGRHTSIAIGADGLGVVSYVDVTNARLKVAHCNDAACSSATTVTLANVGPAGAGTDIAIAGGLPTIAFRDGTVLRIARCVDAVCSDATATSYPGGGNNPTIATGGDGLPLVAHDTGVRIFLGHCSDTACTSASFITIFSPGIPKTEGAFLFIKHSDPQLATGPDGRGVLTHVKETITAPQHVYEVKVDRCQNAACTSLVPSGSFFVGVSPVAGGDPVIGIDPSDVPWPAWTRTGSTHYLDIGRCSTPLCTGGVKEVIAGPGAGRFPALAMSPAGRALITYHDEATGQFLKAAYLDGTPSADLTPSVQDSPDPVAPTQPLRYTLGAQNLGPNTALAVTIHLALPAGATFVANSGCAYDPQAHAVSCALTSVAPGVTTSAGSVDVAVPPGLPGPITAVAAVGSATADPDPGNNTAAVATGTIPGLRVDPPTVIEGSSGPAQGRFDLAVLDDGNGLPSPVTVFYGMGGGTATPGVDYLPALGALTFATASTQSVTVAVVGDLALEPDETFFLQLSSPLVVVANPAATIVDDDVAASAEVELGHGSSLLADLRSDAAPVPPADVYRVVVPARASYEVTVDSISGDVLPLGLERLTASGTAVLQSATASGTGASVSLRWQNTTALPVASQLIRIRSGGCATDCGADDVYRTRAYETTARIPRFNNTATQTTVLILQNPSHLPIAATAHFWNAAGQPIASSPLTIGPRATSVASTASLVPGQSGSLTVSHDAPYGVLQGKAVAIEPATGFSFDSPLVYRPR